MWRRFRGVGGDCAARSPGSQLPPSPRGCPSWALRSPACWRVSPTSPTAPTNHPPLPFTPRPPPVRERAASAHAQAPVRFSPALLPTLVAVSPAVIRRAWPRLRLTTAQVVRAHLRAPPPSPPPPVTRRGASAIGRNGDVCAAAAAPSPPSAAPAGPGRDVCGDDAAAAAEPTQDAAHTCQLSWCAACGGGKGEGGGGGGGALCRGRGAAGSGVVSTATVAPAVPGGGRRRRHWPQPRVPNTHAALGAVRRRWRRRGGTRLVDGGGLPLCRGGGHRRGGGGVASRDGSERWRWRRGWPLPGFLPTRGADGGAGGGGQKTPRRRPPSVWSPHQRLAVHLVCVGVIHAHHVAWHGERGKDAAVPSLSPCRAAVPHFLFGDQLAGAGGGGRRWGCDGARWGRGGWWRRWPPAGPRRGAAVVFGARVDHVGASGSGR